jgi:hypothetical protein
MTTSERPLRFSADEPEGRRGPGPSAEERGRHREPGEPLAARRADALIQAAQAFGLDIDARTNESLWEGPGGDLRAIIDYLAHIDQNDPTCTN